MDLFRVLIIERSSELCLIDQNSEEVHDLQSPDEKMVLLLSALVERFCVSRMRDFLCNVINVDTVCKKALAKAGVVYMFWTFY